MKPDNDFFKHVRAFLTVYLPRHRCYSQHTVKAYRDTLNLFRQFLLEEKKIALHRSYTEQFKKVITIRQVVKLTQSEHRFRKELLRRSKERREGGGGRKRQ